MAENFNIDVRQDGSVALSGYINEDVILEDVFKGEGRLVLDLSGVERINSCGVREWINAIRAISERPIVYTGCSQAIVEQFNMISNFCAHGQVESFLAPYSCRTCDKDMEMLLSITEHGSQCINSQAPDMACPDCGEALEFDEDEDEYFMFLEE